MENKSLLIGGIVVAAILIFAAGIYAGKNLDKLTPAPISNEAVSNNQLKEDSGNQGNEYIPPLSGKNINPPEQTEPSHPPVNMDPSPEPPVTTVPGQKPGEVKNPSGFCGSSTYDSCSSDGDCEAGGCSGQICGKRGGRGMVSTCEYSECYDAQKYGVQCGCSGGKCQWR